MKTFSIRSLGCKVNPHESREIRPALEHLGPAPIGIGQAPDWVVVKTCCVCPTNGDDTPSSPVDLIRPNPGLQIKPKDLNGLQTLPSMTRLEGRTRALLKVQEGFNGHCAYCIRPMLGSPPLQIVLNGVYLDAYGRKTVRHRKWPAAVTCIKSSLNRPALTTDILK